MDQEADPAHRVVGSVPGAGTEADRVGARDEVAGRQRNRGLAGDVAPVGVSRQLQGPVVVNPDRSLFAGVIGVAEFHCQFGVGEIFGCGYLVDLEDESRLAASQDVEQLFICLIRTRPHQGASGLARCAHLRVLVVGIIAGRIDVDAAAGFTTELQVSAAAVLPKIAAGQLVGEGHRAVGADDVDREREIRPECIVVRKDLPIVVQASVLGQPLDQCAAVVMHLT